MILALTRPSKLRLPDRTAASGIPAAASASTVGSSGPELPMHVIQPKPATVKPSAARESSSPAAARYAGTAREPGESDVLTEGLLARPARAAFLASRPAVISSRGLAVLVQLVIAAMATAPSGTTLPAGGSGPGPAAAGPGDVRATS